MTRRRALALDEETYGRIEARTGRANQLFSEGRYEPALAEFEAALAFVPPPAEEWEASAYALAGIADCLFHLGRYAEALPPLERAMQCPGAPGNPFFHLRLGQVHYQLGDLERAAAELMRAWRIGGTILFEGEDPQYLVFICRSIGKT